MQVTITIPDNFGRLPKTEQMRVLSKEIIPLMQETKPMSERSQDGRLKIKKTLADRKKVLTKWQQNRSEIGTIVPLSREEIYQR